MGFTYLLVSLGAGLSVFIIFIAINGSRPKKIDDSDSLELLKQRTETEENLIGEGFLKVARKKGLQTAINQAHLDVTVAQFIRFMVIIFIVTTVIATILLGTLMVGMGVGVIADILYFIWLSDRRDKKVLEYEEAVADFADRLANGANIQDTLVFALKHAQNVCPKIMQDDIDQVVFNYDNNISFEKCWEEVQEKRQSQALDVVVASLKTYTTHGSAIPLQDVLSPLTDVIRDNAMERSEQEAKLTAVKFQQKFVTVMPIFLDIFIRNIMPNLSTYLDSMQGMIAQLAAFSIALFGFYLGNQQIKKIRKQLEIERRE